MGGVSTITGMALVALVSVPCAAEAEQQPGVVPVAELAVAEVAVAEVVVVEVPVAEMVVVEVPVAEVVVVEVPVAEVAVVEVPVAEVAVVEVPVAVAETGAPQAGIPQAPAVGPAAVVLNMPGVVQVAAIHASNRSRAFDPQLQSYRPELKRMRFKNYELIEASKQNVQPGDQYGMELPGNRYLHITALDSTAEYLQLRVLVNENNRPIVNTDVRINRGAPLLIAGPKMGNNGTLILAIRATPPGPAPQPASARVAGGQGRPQVAGGATAPVGVNASSREQLANDEVPTAIEPVAIPAQAPAVPAAMPSADLR